MTKEELIKALEKSKNGGCPSIYCNEICAYFDDYKIEYSEVLKSVRLYLYNRGVITLILPINTVLNAEKIIIHG